MARTVAAPSCAPLAITSCSVGENFFHSASEKTRKVGSIRCRVIAMQQATSLNLNDSVVAAVCS